jgi:hypothetical protein
MPLIVEMEFAILMKIVPAMIALALGTLLFAMEVHAFNA